jgi:hypothetical protein
VCSAITTTFTTTTFTATTFTTTTTTSSATSSTSSVSTPTSTTTSTSVSTLSSTSTSTDTTRSSTTSTSTRTTTTTPARRFDFLVNAVDVLDPSLVAPPATGVTVQADGGVLFVGVAGQLLSTPPRLQSSEWTMSVDVTQVNGVGGYLLASTDAAGFVRYAALYSGTTRMTLYYYTVAGTRRSVRFATTIADGQRHSVTLAVSGSTAVLLVDRAAPLTAELVLDGGVTTAVCGNADGCSFVLGARADATSTTAFMLSGILHRAVVVTNKAVSMHVTATNFTTRGVFEYPPTSVDWLSGQSRAVFLTGQQGFPVQEHNYSVEAAFSVALLVRVVPGDSGYLFAKGTASGSRFYSLFASNTHRRVSMYYTSGGIGLRVDFSVHIADGGIYHVLLSVNGTSVRLFVDDVQIGSPQLIAPIQDCGARSADCLLTLGERPSPNGGAHRLAGLFYDAQFVNGTALETYPFYSRRLV